MTSPSLLDGRPGGPKDAPADPPPGQAPAVRPPEPAWRRFGIPLLLAVVTLCSTTAVGMRYMHNFRLGAAPYSTDADILPYGWVLANLRDWTTGLPFSLTLIGILLAHEFGHYFACRYFKVRATLPWLLPAPSLSGTFGAVIRLRSAIRTRAALIVIGASGPIAGFVVAIFTVMGGISLSHYGPAPIMKVEPTALIAAIHALMHPHADLSHIIPHPVLTASWIGVLITALNLIPAGQLDGGHIVYSVSPEAHRLCSRVVVAALLILGIFFWAGWIVWAIVLLTPAMRHPRIPDPTPLTRAQLVLVPLCAILFLFCLSYAPFHGYSVIDGVTRLPHRYGHH